jgi:hypothetical protein
MHQEVQLLDLEEMVQQIQLQILPLHTQEVEEVEFIKLVEE